MVSWRQDISRPNMYTAQFRLINNNIYIYKSLPTFCRKVAKVLQDDKSKKRKSDSPIADLLGSENVVKEKRSAMTSPIAVQSTSAQTENTGQEGGQAAEG